MSATFELITLHARIWVWREYQSSIFCSAKVDGSGTLPRKSARALHCRFDQRAFLSVMGLGDLRFRTTLVDRKGRPRGLRHEEGEGCGHDTAGQRKPTNAKRPGQRSEPRGHSYAQPEEISLRLDASGFAIFRLGATSTPLRSQSRQTPSLLLGYSPNSGHPVDERPPPAGSPPTPNVATQRSRWPQVSHCRVERAGWGSRRYPCEIAAYRSRMFPTSSAPSSVTR
jgi:hypothetical protein